MSEIVSRETPAEHPSRAHARWLVCLCGTLCIGMLSALSGLFTEFRPWSAVAGAAVTALFWCFASYGTKTEPRFGAGRIAYASLGIMAAALVVPLAWQLHLVEETALFGFARWACLFTACALICLAQENLGAMFTATRRKMLAGAAAQCACFVALFVSPSVGIVAMLLVFGAMTFACMRSDRITRRLAADA